MTSLQFLLHRSQTDQRPQQNQYICFSIQSQMSSKEKIDLQKLPKHIAVIMDGNGRWAKKKGMPRVFGHRSGVQSVREITEAAAEIGIEYLSLYAFSTENWSRPALEVNALMTLLVETIKKEIATLQENNIRLQAIGDLEKLPSRTHKALLEAIENTKDNKRMTLVLALNYSGKWDITQAMNKLKMSDGEISQEDISSALSTAGIPDPEFMIRTSGEERISNFFLWQMAYSEFYFTPVMWPAFRKEHFYEAMFSYQNRERRFGQTGEQL